MSKRRIKLPAMALHNKNYSLPKYKMSFTIGGLFYQEAVLATDLYMKSKDWSQVREEIFKTKKMNIIHPLILTKRVARALLSDKSGLYIVLPVSDADFKEWIK